MLRNLVSNIYFGIKGFLGPSVIDGRVNPLRVAFARKCYDVQSRIFRIPDRFGFFSPGPPRLQEEQSFRFVIVIIFTGHMILDEGITTFILHLMGDRSVKSIAVMLGLVTMTVVGAIWYHHMCLNSHRAPNYVWKDRKVRTK